MRGKTKRILIILTLMISAISIFVMTGSAATYTVDDSGGADYTTIQAAINAASDGDTITIAAGVYTETLNLQGKELTIIGAGLGNTIINASTFTGYAIQNFGDNTTIKDLSLIGTNHYGFKVSHVSNVSLENIRVEKSGKTGVDLNTIDGATLNNIQVVDTVGGFGIMILDSNDVDVTDIMTENNAWGGVSIHAVNANADTINFFGQFDAKEDSPLLLEQDPPYGAFINVDIPDKFNFVVYAFRVGPNYKQWYYQETLADAKAFANGLMGSAFTYTDMLIYNIDKDTYHVIPGMLINDAVQDATIGDTIMVDTGTYDEIVIIDKANIIMTAASDPVIQPTTAASWPTMGAVNIMADGVTFQGFEVDGSLMPGNHEVINAYGVSDVTIADNIVHGATSGTWDGMGIAVWDWDSAKTVNYALIQNNIVYDTGRMGIFCMDYDTINSEYDLTEGHRIIGNEVYNTWKKGNDWGDAGGGIQINVGKNCNISDNVIYNTNASIYGDHYNPCIYMFGSGTGNIIKGNTLRNSNSGITLWISGEGGSPIDWEEDTAASPTVYCNDIYDNTNYGAFNLYTETTPIVLNAVNNWWGQKSGPYHPTLNPSGTGDNVSDDVDFDPWATYTPPCGPAPKTAVGGIMVPVDKTSILLSYSIYIALFAALLLIGTLLYKKHQK